MSKRPHIYQKKSHALTYNHMAPINKHKNSMETKQPIIWKISFEYFFKFGSSYGMKQTLTFNISNMMTALEYNTL